MHVSMRGLAMRTKLVMVALMSLAVAVPVFAKTY
jgi:hypothetical protein